MKMKPDADKRTPPTPEEIHREFEDFVKNRFGESVKIFSQQVVPGDEMNETAAKATTESKAGTKAKFKFDYKPKDVKAFLDRFVIQQDDAKKALAIAVCDHYNHVKQCLEKTSSEAYEYSKQNVLILGPTGVGKTYLVKSLAKL